MDSIKDKPKYITCTTIASFAVTRIIVYYNYDIDHIFPGAMLLLIGSMELLILPHSLLFPSITNNFFMFNIF